MLMNKKMNEGLCCLLVAVCALLPMGVVAQGLTDVQRHDSIAVCIEQARQGDAHAYVKMARLYLQDSNPERALMKAGMMAYLANQRGTINGNWMVWLADQPEGETARLAVQVIKLIDGKDYEGALRQGDALAAAGIPGECIEICIGMDKRTNQEETVGRARELARRGSLLGRYLYALLAGDKDSLYALAPEMPVLYNGQARDYGTDDELSEDDCAHKVALYYEADRQGCLASSGANWLVYYFDRLAKRGRKVDAAEMERLRRLTGPED